MTLLDGPSKQGKLTGVTNSTPVEAKVGAEPLEDRQVITLQPDANIKVFFADEGIVPSASTVLNNGFDHFKNVKETYEAGARQKVYIISVTGTVNVIIAERA